METNLKINKKSSYNSQYLKFEEVYMGRNIFQIFKQNKKIPDISTQKQTKYSKNINKILTPQ